MNMLRKIVSILRNPRLMTQWLDQASHTSLVTMHWPPLFHAVPSTFDFDLQADISIAPDAMIGPFSEIVVRPAGTSSTLPGSLRIGDRVYIGSRANIRAAGGRIDIGHDVLIAQNVSLIASNHGMRPDLTYREQGWDAKKTSVIIGSNVWIGTGAILLPGITVGDRAVVAAGSVVTKSVPAGELWAGVPARKIRSLQDS
jgi:acetyltransferase-like isoleucine patch superfamily enzyme